MPRAASKGYSDPVLANIAMDYSTAALKGLVSEAVFPSVECLKGIPSTPNLAKAT